MGDADTTPTSRARHGATTALRGLMSTPSSTTTNGRFGRMFRQLPVYEQAPASLIALGKAMIQELEDGAARQAARRRGRR